MRPFTREEELAMWKFLLKEAPNPFTGLFERERIRPRGLSIWEKFKEDVGSIRTVTSLRKRFSMPSFPTPFDLDFTYEERMQLMYAFQIPVDVRLIPLLTENGDLELNHENKIVRYKEHKEGGLELYLVARQGWVPPRRKAPAEQKPPVVEEKKLRLHELLGMSEEPPVEENFYDDDVPYDEPAPTYDWILPHPVKTEPVEQMSMPPPAPALATPPPAPAPAPIVVSVPESVPRTASAASTELSISEPVEKKDVDLIPMQDFFVSLKEAIVSSHSTMLSAVKELVPAKTEPSPCPSKLKKKKKKRSLAQNGFTTPLNSEKVPRREFLERYAELLSTYSSPALDSVKREFETAIQGIPEEEKPGDQMEVKRVKLMSETILAMMGH